MSEKFTLIQTVWAWDSDPADAIKGVLTGIGDERKSYMVVKSLREGDWKWFKHISATKPVVEIIPQIEGYEFMKIECKDGDLVFKSKHGVDCLLYAASSIERFAGYWYSCNPNKIYCYPSGFSEEDGHVYTSIRKGGTPVRPSYVAFKREGTK